MNRTYIYLSCFLCLLTFLGLFSCTSSQTEETKSQIENPNIVWISIEDQSPQFFPMYGDESVSLPNIEALAEESIIYDNAFANVPVCAPARSTIILGQYVVHTGTHNMRTFNAYNPQNEASIEVPSYTPVMGPRVKEFTKYLRAKGYYCTNNAKEDFNFQKTDGVYDESSNKAHYRNRDNNQPFFNILNIGVCHESGIWRMGEDSLFVDPKTIEVPPYFPDDPAIRHDLAVNYSNLVRMDRQAGELIEQLKEDGLYDESYIFFFSDHGGPLPRHKRVLYDTGIKVPMMVKLPKSMQDEEPQKRTDEIVSFIDLAPTVLSISGIPIPDYMHGKAFLGDQKGLEDEYVYASSDRFDEIYDRSRAVRSKTVKYIRNYHPELPYAIPVTYREQMNMMKKWRELDEDGLLEGTSALWMRDQKEAEELYDLEKDPFEINNIINDPEYKNQLEELRNAMDSWQEEMNDLGEIDEKELISKWADMKNSIQLEAPEIKVTKDGSMISHSNEYGHIVYKGSEEGNWMIYPEGKILNKEAAGIFKVVHIGLNDSEELRIEN